MYRSISTFAVTFLFCLLCLKAFTQSGVSEQSEKPNSSSKVFLLGGIGPAIPLGNFGDERSTGFDLNTAVDFRFNSGLLLRGMFDFSNFGFNTGAITQDVGGQIYQVGGSNNLISLLGSVGYYYPLGRFTPYVFAGLGASFISKPDLEIDESQNVVDINTVVSSYFSNVFGTGIDFVLNPEKVGGKSNKKSATTYLLYLEAFYTSVPTTTNISVHKFNLLSINLGLKTSF